MNSLIYEINGATRPANGLKQRICLMLNKWPVIREIPFIKKRIFKAFNLPATTSISNNFYCSAPNIKLGDHVGLADSFIVAYAPVTIGNNCSFSFRNMIITSTHDLNNFSTVIAKPINIGNNVWITTNVTILPGVTIGDNTVIGAGSVVTKDIPSNVFAAGNPCEIIRQISLNK